MTALACALAGGVSACGGSSTELELDGEVVRIEIEPVTALLPGPGDAVSFSAKGFVVSGTQVDVQVTWLSDNSAVATVDAMGVARAVATGITTIRATAGSAIGIATVAVDPDIEAPSLVTVWVDRTSVSVLLGPALVRLHAEFTDDRSGVSKAFGQFDGPFGAAIDGIIVLDRIEESGTSSVWEGFVTVQPNSGVRLWTLSVLRADDRFGNVS